MHKIKSLYLTIISILYFNNLVSMEHVVQKINEQYACILSMPNELMINIIANVIKEHMKDWQDIFNFDKENFKKVIENIRLICRKFNSYFDAEYLIKIIRILKQERLCYLFMTLKDQFESEDSILSLEELNANLIEILNKEILSQADLTEAVNLLLHNTDFNAKDRNGNNALILSYIKGHKFLVKVIIAAGANINIQDELGNTILIIDYTDNCF
ncbi:ankyrin repeat domain-containing protein [Candidatus Babela massiliensis]|uniref:Ankyrin repeats containing protein n=1 Tax=Candidatus Babela massiliensis TaxID=673862 RepID=V6DJJ9_9BACT|nr:ankyrin repeat domain-containing protein [Candidatus Babela massiliensis]CDK31058.1 Ankyrin repeats containing protein [Candidatus Babela massiliensis]